MSWKVSAFVFQESYLCSLPPAETPLSETLTPAGILASFPLLFSFHTLLTPAGRRSCVKTVAEGGKWCCRPLTQWGGGKAMNSTACGMHRGQQEAAGLIVTSCHGNLPFWGVRRGKWSLFLDIIQCNNQIRKELKALWAGLCSLGQHSPVTELGHVFPSRWCLLCISLLHLGSGLRSGSVHL